MSFTTIPDTIVSSRLKVWLPYGLLALAVFVSYADIYQNVFLYDDLPLIKNNSLLQQGDSFGALFAGWTSNTAHHAVMHFYRPLQTLLFWLIYQIAGPTLIGFHALNVSLHATNACLLYALSRKFQFHSGAAFAATLLWALHPLHTEAITYMSGMADPLFVLFTLLGLIVLVPDFSLRKMFLALPLYLCALLSKETAIIFPLLAMSCLFLVSNERLSMKTYLRTWPLWTLTLAYLAVRFFVLLHNTHEQASADYLLEHGASLSLRIYTFFAAVPVYLELLLWPAGLHMDWDFPLYESPWYLSVLIGMGVLAAAVAQILYERGNRNLALSWGLLWFAAAFLPQTGIFITINAVFYEHWMYLPSAGLFLGVGETIAGRLSSAPLRPTVGATALLVALVFGWLTYEQNQIWQNPITLYQNILAYENDPVETPMRSQPSARIHDSLGSAYVEKGDYQQAMEQFQLAIKGHDASPLPHQHIASLLLKEGGLSQLPEFIAELQRALVIDPSYLMAYDELAFAYDQSGDADKAAFYRAEAQTIREKRRNGD